MNEKVENLLLEHLRIIRADMSSMKDEMSGMRAEMLIIRQHMAGLLGAQVLHDGEIAGIKVRLDRIEKRMELAD
jgi:non-ribosomal peptide synthetase component E (peptide arylation enzyme)